MNFFREAGKNIWRDRGISFATIFVTTLTLSVTSLFVLALVGSGLALDYLESKAQLTAFFTNEASEAQVLALQGALQKMTGVLEVSYTSKEEALDIYKEDYQDEPMLLESISANIFPASLDIRAEKIEDLELVNRRLQVNDLVEEVIYFQDVAANFQRVSTLVRQVGLVLVAILTTISLLIILLSIGMSIHRKKEEIEIMRLIGASKWYIRLPFVIQGAFYGVVAVLVSFVLILALIPVGYPVISSFLSGMPLPELTPLLAAELILGELLGAGLLGAFGAMLAIRKYLRV